VVKKREKKATKPKVRKKQDPVIKAAKELQKTADPIEVTLLTGAKATLHPVSPVLIQDVQMAIENPTVPTVWDKVKEREVENPDDPSYIAALEWAEAQRVQAVMDAQIMFGVELEEGFEVSPKWVKRLKRLGLEFDEDDPDEVEFAYKKYGVSNQIMILLARLSGISEEDVERFRDLFRG